MSATIYAAGTVCWRASENGLEVLLVRRSRYGDMTIPKGKVDPGETLPETAVRETLEETGLRVALGPPIGVSTYTMPSGRTKEVHYWAARVTNKALDASDFAPNDEISDVFWLSLESAREQLSYRQDVDILENFAALAARGLDTFAIIMLRHAKAVTRSSWADADSRRPLTSRGVVQAMALVNTIPAWKPRRIVSSDAVRCLETVTPLADALGKPVQVEPGVSQDSWESDGDEIRRVLSARIREGKGAVICSHGPVLPEILRVLAEITATVPGGYLKDAANLETGGFSVAHLSRSKPNTGIIAIETYPPQG